MSIIFPNQASPYFYHNNNSQCCHLIHVEHTRKCFYHNFPIPRPNTCTRKRFPRESLILLLSNNYADLINFVRHLRTLEKVSLSILALLVSPVQPTYAPGQRRRRHTVMKLFYSYLFVRPTMCADAQCTCGQC